MSMYCTLYSKEQMNELKQVPMNIEKDSEDSGVDGLINT